MISDEHSAELTMLKRVNGFFANNENRSSNHGLIFIGVRGEDRRLPDSPSWFNGAEAKSVCTLLWTKKIIFSLMIKFILGCIISNQTV